MPEIAPYIIGSIIGLPVGIWVVIRIVRPMLAWMDYKTEKWFDERFK